MACRRGRRASLEDRLRTAVNSTLRRARATLTGVDRDSAPSQPAADESELLAAYIDTFDRGDIDTLVGVLLNDAILEMPPFELWLQGRDAIRRFLLAVDGVRDELVTPYTRTGHRPLPCTGRQRRGAARPRSPSTCSTSLPGASASCTPSSTRRCSKCSAFRPNPWPNTARSAGSTSTGAARRRVRRTRAARPGPRWRGEVRAGVRTGTRRPAAGPTPPRRGEVGRDQPREHPSRRRQRGLPSPTAPSGSSKPHGGASLGVRRSTSPVLLPSASRALRNQLHQRQKLVGPAARTVTVVAHRSRRLFVAVAVQTVMDSATSRIHPA